MNKLFEIVSDIESEIGSEPAREIVLSVANNYVKTSNERFADYLENELKKRLQVIRYVHQPTLFETAA